MSPESASGFFSPASSKSFHFIVSHMSDHLFSSIHHSRHPSLPALNPLFHKSLLSPSSSITHGFKPTVSQILPIADRLRPAGLPSRTDDLVRTVCANRFFGRPFVKRFALCYPTVVCLSVLSCLSVTLVYCSQTVKWIKMKLGMQIRYGHGDIVLDRTQLPLPRKGTSPNFRPISVVAKWLNGLR